MIIFVYFFDNKLKKILKILFCNKLKFKPLNFNKKIKVIIDNIKKSNFKNFVFFNFYKESYPFEYFISILKNFNFYYFYKDKKEIKKLPLIIQKNIKNIFKIENTNIMKQKIKKSFNQKLRIKFTYIFNKSVEILNKNNTEILKNKYFKKFKLKLKNKGKFKTKYFYHNKGKLCILFIHDNYLYLYHCKQKIIYRLINSNNNNNNNIKKKYKYLVQLKQLIEATSSKFVVVLNVNKNNDILLTLVKTISNGEYNFLDILNFFKDSMYKNLKINKLEVIETEIYYNQRFNSIVFYIPKIFDNTKLDSKKIKISNRFNNITYLDKYK